MLARLSRLSLAAVRALVFVRRSRRATLSVGLWLLSIGALAGCASPQATVEFAPADAPIVGSTPVGLAARVTIDVPREAPATPTPPPTATNRPPTATPKVAPSPTVLPSPTQAAACADRVPTDDLLTLVTMEYGLSRDYEPADLVSLSEFLPPSVTLGYPTAIREPVVQPLVDIVAAMQAAGLRPTIISGYRSYAAQAIARAKWLEKEPDRVSILSAPPGHSEHQLGTTVDFGTPELADMLGDQDVEFHTYFYKTAVGEWLEAHAHEYGFTLSYPRDSLELTGFFYEPWHYRYVGSELAGLLKAQQQTLTAYLRERYPPPCPG